MVTLPELVTAAVGEYETWNELLAPGAIVLGVVRPEIPKGLPLQEIEEMVRLEPPTLFTVMVPLAVVPTATLPRFKLAGLTAICCGATVALPARATCPEETPVSVRRVNVPVAFPAAVASNQT